MALSHLGPKTLHWPTSETLSSHMCEKFLLKWVTPSNFLCDALLWLLQRQEKEEKLCWRREVRKERSVLSSVLDLKKKIFLTVEIWYLWFWRIKFPSLLLEHVALTWLPSHSLSGWAQSEGLLVLQLKGTNSWETERDRERSFSLYLIVFFDDLYMQY